MTSSHKVATTRVDNQLSLNEGLAQLNSSGANGFKPARFFYIESLYQRSLLEGDSVAKILQDKALEALTRYQQDFNQARETAEQVLKTLVDCHPDELHPKEQQRLIDALNSGDFSAIHRQASTQVSASQAVLSSLTHELINSRVNANQTQKEPTFDDFLQQQELGALQSISDNSHVNIASPNNSANTLELFKDVLNKLNTEKFVEQVVKEVPENPGPLNAHGLVIRTLSTMQELSPRYLSRLVSYIDTLFWLDEASNKPAPAKPKKRQKNKHDRQQKRLL